MMAEKYKCTTDYVCVHDYQGTEWCIGITDSIEGWRERAIGWANDDDMLDIAEEIYCMPEEDVMKYISDVWAIGFEEVKDVENKTEIKSDVLCTLTEQKDVYD